MSLFTFNETVSFQFTELNQSFSSLQCHWHDWLDFNVNKAEESNNINSSIKTESQILFNNPFKTEKHVLSGSAA